MWGWVDGAILLGEVAGHILVRARVFFVGFGRIARALVAPPGERLRGIGFGMARPT
jgi:hypothetical protein